MVLEEDSLARAPFRREAVGAEGALEVVAELPVLAASQHRRGRDARAGAR